MTVEELIDQLNGLDKTAEVYFVSSGELETVDNVDYEIKYSPYDQDFDEHVVVIRG
jgi:hypothetical protein